MSETLCVSQAPGVFEESGTGAPAGVTSVPGMVPAVRGPAGGLAGYGVPGKLIGPGLPGVGVGVSVGVGVGVGVGRGW